MDDALVFSIFIIFSGAAVFATIALFTRQSLLVAYLILGMLLGPWGLRWIPDPEIIQQIGDVGIIFLLFLLGLHLQPQNLWHMLRQTTLVALVSSLIFAGIGYFVAGAFGYNQTESLVVGAAMMFSSTIIGLKLLPTTILHHQHTGEVMISVLLLQDIIAIIVLLVLNGASSGGFTIKEVFSVALALPALLIVAFVAQRYALMYLLRRFDKVQEYVFLLSIGWCLGMAELAKTLGLSDEIGAFIAGVAIAASPIALFIAESLKPLRDFFLIIFFFAVGASFNTNYLGSVFIPSLVLALLVLLCKPVLFRFLLVRVSETPQVAWEVGMRLGQASEFSLLVAYLAATNALISESALYLIQATTLITFVVSSYVVVFRFPTPMAVDDKLRRD